MRIKHNAPADFARHQVRNSLQAWEKSAEKLSSGERINQAGDDPAGLGLSERMRSQIRGMDKAMRNAADGISLLQIAESGLSQGTDVLQRMREVSVQAANGIYGSDDYRMFDEEIGQLTAEIDRIAENARFGDIKLLAAETKVRLHIGPNADPDAKEGAVIEVLVPPARADNLGLIDAATKQRQPLTSAEQAEKLLQNVDTALDTLHRHRSGIGALQNRLENAIGGLEYGKVNLGAAESRIRDTDMAREMTELTRSQILLDSSSAMLAQANLLPRDVLRVLGPQNRER